MKASYLIVLFFCLTGLSNCSKCKVADGVSNCIKKKTKNFCKSQDCETAFVGEYMFQGERVYAFSPGNCGADMQTEVVDQDCETLGYLGGIVGNTKINGEEFYNATLDRVIWEKNDK